MSTLKRFAILVMALVVLAMPALAQVNRSVIEGTVTDPSGASISGASVTVTNVDTGITQERHANPNGYYRFPGLASGEYTVIVTNSGFKTKTIEDVSLAGGQTRTLDVRLEIGEASEKVEITAEEEPADRSSAAASTVLDKNQIENLSVNGRDWSALTLLAPFAQDDGGGNQRTIRYGGRAIDDNNFNFDGVDAGGIQEQAQKSQVRLQISTDAIAEYRVNTALYTAEYGTQAGGQIDVITKSGTNNWHGTGFGYLRNSVFDARNFTDFDINGNPAIPPFRLGQYGMTLGGAVIKDNTFFFLSYEGLRQLQSTTQRGYVPSAAFQQQVLVTGSGGAGPSPQMCSILQAFPWRASVGTIGGCAPVRAFPDAAFSLLSSDTTGSTDSFTHQTPSTIHEDTWLVRVDHKFSDKTTLYGRAQRDILFANAPNSALFDTLNTINHPANYFIALQHSFTPTIFNETKLFINRSPFHNPQASVLPYSVDTGGLFTTINNNNADIEVGTTYGVIDNLTWAHGRHTFKAGMEFRWIRLNQGKTADNILTFGSFQDLLNGQIAKDTFNAPWCCHKFRRTMYLPYFQDEWKITPTFTANLGIRWEYYGVEHVPDNRTTVFDLNQFHGACLGSGSFNAPFTVPVNTPPCPKNPSLYDPNYRNFDPRVSFAWAPAALNGKTVVRAGFGIYSGAAQNDDLNAGLESDTFRASVNSVPVGPPYQQETPDLSGAPKTANHPRALQRHGRRDQYVETWGLSIDHELPAHFQISGSYLGSHGVRLFSRGAVNLCSIPVTINSTGTDCIRPLDQYFPDPNNPDPYGSVDYKGDFGQSTYNAMLITLERRLSNGLSFQAHYTWSHSINDGAVGGGEANGQQNVNCRQCDKGPSVFDIRHNVTVNAVYELPFGPGKQYMNEGGVLGKIVGGWEMSGIGTWHTGHPLTVIMDLSGTVASGPFAGNFANTYLLPDGNDQTSQRPDIIPGVPLYLPGKGLNGTPGINPAAFQAPPVDANGNFTRFGNSGNGVVRALNIWQIDFALQKETKLTERFDLEFGVQFFNILNHVQYGDFGNLNLAYCVGVSGCPASNLSVPGSFAQITNTVNGLGTNTGNGLARQIQFMMRVKF